MSVKRSTFLTCVLLSCFALASCALPVKTQKLDSNARAIQDLSIFMAVGDLAIVRGKSTLSVDDQNAYRDEFPRAMKTIIPKIFDINGVVVQSINVVSGNAKFSPLSQSIPTAASHYLTVQLESFEWATENGRRWADFHAWFQVELWDMQSRRVVWRARPVMVVTPDRPLRRSKELAARILNALQSDGLIALKHGQAVDDEGRAIGYDPWKGEFDK